MPHPLDGHPHFTRHDDPESGVRSYILTQRVAPIQQSFYFTNPSLSADEKWLWFYCAFPPAEGHTLGVLSMYPARPPIRHFPQAAFASASPLDVPTRTHTHVWKRPLCHAHCDATRRLWCADESPYRWNDQPCQVLLFDRETRKEAAIVTVCPI